MKNLKNSFAFLGLLTFIVFMAAACRKAPTGVTITSDASTISVADGGVTFTADVEGDFSWLQWYVKRPGDSEAVESTGGVLDMYYLGTDAGPGQYVVYAEARNCSGNKDATGDCKNKTKSNEITIIVTP